MCSVRMNEAGEHSRKCSSLCIVCCASCFLCRRAKKVIPQDSGTVPNEVDLVRGPLLLRKKVIRDDLTRLCPPVPEEAWKVHYLQCLKECRLYGLLDCLGVKSKIGCMGPILYFHPVPWRGKGFLISLYGGKGKILEKVRINLNKKVSDLRIAGSYPPPFRPLAGQEKREVIEPIHAAGPDILFVSLGAPKQ